MQSKLAVTFLEAASVTNVRWRSVNEILVIIGQVTDAQQVVVTADLAAVSATLSSAHVVRNVEAWAGCEVGSAVARSISDRRVSGSLLKTCL